MSKYSAIPNTFMTVGEVAKKMGVTVRTRQIQIYGGVFEVVLQEKLSQIC